MSRESTIPRADLRWPLATPCGLSCGLVIEGHTRCMNVKQTVS